MQTIIESTKKIPHYGMLDAGVDFPYSHIITPKSFEAKQVMSQLFGLSKNQTFQQLIEAKMTRREFLKGAKAAAGIGMQMQGKIKDALAGAVGLGAAAPITSTEGIISADWLGRELMYAITKQVVQNNWDAFKTIAEKNGINIPKGEIKTLNKMLATTSIDQLDIYNPFEEYIKKHHANLAKPDVRHTLVKFGDIEDDLYKSKYPELFDSDNHIDSQTDDNQAQNYSNKTYDDDFEIVYDDYEQDGFDDLKPKKKGDEQDWMGENKRTLPIPAPSLKHLSKAWATKSMWLKEIDKILS